MLITLHHTVFRLVVGMVAASCCLSSYAQRQHIAFDDDWQFALGNAASPEKDFGCGTEYFNYLTKAASVHNEGPYTLKFNPEKWGVEWQDVTLPHDWVVDLPYAKEASHSHGYKTVGFRYPETSVGWYRKTFTLPESDFGRHISLQFDGIFRDARVWVNGFYLGHEPSGYATQIYDISEYLNYGGENVVAVRADATLEEGWFYEGAGIYRHVWLNKNDRLHVAPAGVFVHADLAEPYTEAVVTVETTVDNKGIETAGYSLRHTLVGPDGRHTAMPAVAESPLAPMESRRSVSSVRVDNPVLWSLENPALYRVVTEVLRDGVSIDSVTTVTGIRDIRFDPDYGFFLNGRHVKIKGMNMHQDHAGVGAAIPDAVQAFRIRELKKYGVNAYRSSHNPMTPETLDACDSIGMLVLEENRLTGINREHIDLLRRMIERDRNHPSIILWSVGNEEWGTEWNEFGRRISETMKEHCRRFDPTRPATIASSSGPTVLVPMEVAGYNYVEQHPIDEHRANYPSRVALGTEETSGRGTRGVYFDDHARGHMVSINRSKHGKDSIYNCMERAWKFHAGRPWSSGMFYWTGFDYRGEPNPMKFPATGSQPGVLDYCGFPKDQAYYVKAWWGDEPVLHIFPHWNLKGHEGETIDVWAYSNCDEVELIANGRKLGRKAMPKNGHLSWKAVYNPGVLKAIGYKNGKKILEKKIETTDEPSRIIISADRNTIKADNKDVAVFTIEIRDSKGRFVPDANIELNVSLNGEGRILGYGNGDPAWQAKERPTDGNSANLKTFNGLAQLLVQSTANSGNASISISSQRLKSSEYTIAIE